MGVEHKVEIESIFSIGESEHEKSSLLDASGTKLDKKTPKLVVSESQNDASESSAADKFAANLAADITADT
jgi:hypothetical protein